MSTTIESSKTLNLALQLDTDQRTSWLANIFQPYVSSFGRQVTDDLDWRFLGMSNLKSGIYGATEVSFFELFEPMKKEQDQPTIPALSAEESLSPTPLTMTSSPMVTDESDISTTTYCQDFFLESSTLTEYKKHTIVMSLDTQVFKPSNRQPYYIFPTDAIVEKVSQTPPYELFCSFHALEFIHNGSDMDTSIEYNNDSPLTKQQCYTDFPSSPLLSDTTKPDVKMEQTIKDGPLITHLSLSGISKELYLVIKNSVATFESTYEKMIQLMKLHTEGISHRCAELLFVDLNDEAQSKKSKIESKPNKGKRKGSYQQRQTSPQTTVSTVITTTTTSVSSTNGLLTATATLPSKVKSITSTSPIMVTSKQSPASPIVGTTSSNSTPINSSANQRQNTANAAGRKCSYCGSKTTPMWRRGPEGAGTLCNACGVKWKHGKILCGKQPGPDITNGSASAPTKSTNGCSSASITAEKKRKQHDGLKLKKDKRVKMQRQQQQQQQQRRLLQKGPPSNESLLKDEDLDSNDEEEEEDDEEDNFSYDDNDEDEDEDERMKHNIVAARHLTIHESPQQYQHPYYTPSSLPESQSRPRSMTNYTENNNYLSYQQPWGQDELAIPQGFQAQQSQPPYYLQYNDQRQPYYLPYNEQQHHYRPRRHTADVSVLERGAWGEYPQSMGIDAVEAATVLTLLKRSSQT